MKENKIEEIYNKIKQINKLSFKKEKEGAIKEANKILNEAEETIIVISENQTMVNGSPFNVINLLYSAIKKIVNERGIPEDIFKKMIEIEEESEENSIEDKLNELSKKIDSLMED